MNNGAFGENFPYSNFHDLNMDWIIKIAKDFLDQYTHIQEIIANGEQSLQDLTTSGLEQLQDKADALEALLQQWYNEHSEDIANELQDAISSLNSWYTTHQNYLDATLTEKTASFNRQAEQKTEELLNTIPSEYTELYNEVLRLIQTIEYITENTTNRWIWGDFLNFTTQANITENVNIPAGTYMFSAEIESNDTSQTSSSMYLYDANDNSYPINLNRGNRSGRTVTIPADIVRIRLYASTSYSSSNGKTASWRKIGIFPDGTQSAYYVPPVTAVDSLARKDIEHIEQVTEKTTNLWTLGNFENFIGQIDAGRIDIPAGRYMISAVITSSDTDATSSKMTLLMDNNETFDVFLNRDTRSGRTVTIPHDVKSATLYASNASGASAGDTASWVNIGIFPNGTPTVYYVPPITAIDSIARQKIRSFINWNDTAKIVWFGTSIPAGGVGGRYPNIIGNELGVTMYNESIGSSRAKAGYYEFIDASNPLGLTTSYNDTIKAMGYSINDKQLFIAQYDTYKARFTDEHPETIDNDTAKEIIAYSFERKLYRYLNTKQTAYDSYDPTGFIGDVDMYVIDHGYNDFMTNRTFPSDTIIPEDEAPYEMYYFAGAIDRYIREIMKNNIHAKILLISHYSATDKGGRIVEMQNRIAEKWKLPYVKVYESIGWTNIELTINDTTKTIKNWWIPDTIHPSSDPTGKAIRKYVEVILPIIRNVLYPLEA